jgi:hypothetical protein
LGTSVTYVTRSGSLLISTPFEAVNNSGAVVNLACSWIITAPPGFRVSLSFLAFNAQQDIDFFSVYDGNSASMPALISYATGSVPPPAVISSGNSLYVCE